MKLLKELTSNKSFLNTNTPLHSNKNKVKIKGKKGENRFQAILHKFGT